MDDVVQDRTASDGAVDGAFQGKYCSSESRGLGVNSSSPRSVFSGQELCKQAVVVETTGRRWASVSRSSSALCGSRDPGGYPRLPQPPHILPTPPVSYGPESLDASCPRLLDIYIKFLTVGFSKFVSRSNLCSSTTTCSHLTVPWQQLGKQPSGV